jgi:Excalibur calcium-binding domain
MGRAPAYRGQPEYRSHLDRDGDGIACEPYLGMDATDVDSAISVLRALAQQMRHVEEQLDAAGRLFAMRKVRSVRQRVERATVA